MELKLENGTLDLPDDFTFTIERTNPFFSDEGDASIPATIPPTDRNRQLLGNIDRIDINSPHYQEIPAMLSAGVWQKNGQLIVSTASRKDGFEASLAFENSDIYAQFKDKTLKELFANKTPINYGSVSQAVTALQAIYNSYGTGQILSIFPVAVAKYTEGEGDSQQEVYQYNNEIVNGSLVWRSRTVHEGDELVVVPDGYGISPFYNLIEMMRDLVELMGYKLTGHGFPDNTTRFVIINNCSDTICNNGILKWEDLVPSITVAEFFEWLLNRFHIQPFVDSAGKRIEFVCMEEILGYYIYGDKTNITDRVDGGWSIEINKPAHVVLTPTTDIEGAEPAAETFDKLIEKYGYYKEVNEPDWSTIETANNVNYRDCLVLRRSTGVFYEVRHRASNPDIPEVKRLGTNYFAYDRNNEDESEQFSQADTMPPMLCDNATRAVAPYIGERLNFHTIYNNNKEETEQKLMIVVEHFSAGLYYRKTGSTQNYVPYKRGYTNAQITANGTHNEDLYPKFWKLYNEQLRCGKTELTGMVRYTPSEAANFFMCNLVYCGGQNLLPVEISIEIGEHTVCGESKYMLIKNIIDMPVDPTPPQPSSETSGFKWIYKDSYRAVLDEVLASGGHTQTSTIWGTSYNQSDYHYDGILPIPNYSGEKTAEKKIPINIRYFSDPTLTEVPPIEVDTYYAAWYEAVPIQ